MYTITIITCICRIPRKIPQSGEGFVSEIEIIDENKLQARYFMKEGLNEVYQKTNHDGNWGDRTLDIMFHFFKGVGGQGFGDNDNPAWVHVSYVSPEENRNRCLKAYKKNGRTKYKVI